MLIGCIANDSSIKIHLGEISYNEKNNFTVAHDKP